MTLGNAVVTRQVEAGTGEANQNDLALYFGLADEEGPVDVAVRWPDGRTQVVSDVAVAGDGVDQDCDGEDTPTPGGVVDVDEPVDDASDGLTVGTRGCGGGGAALVLVLGVRRRRG